MAMENRLDKLKALQKELHEVQAKIDGSRDYKIRKDFESSRERIVKEALKHFENIDKTLVSKWIISGFEPETIYFTEFFGFKVAIEQLTTSQIRNTYNEVKKIQMSGASDLAKFQNENKSNSSTDGKYSAQTSLIMLAPRLSYAAARSQKQGGKLLKEILTVGIQAVIEADDLEKKVERFDNFSNFFEAILCYHKTAGGKDSEKN